MFLNVPTPTALNLNYCSHNCKYCFANLNKPDRKLDPKKVFNQINSCEKNKNLVSYFLREKYPIMASNLVDVFAKSNYKYFLEIYSMLRKKDIPIYFQTRGGLGVDEVLKTLPKSAFYISITSHDNEIIRKIEPSAPLITERIELVKKLKSLGHEVAIGINPYMPNYCDAEKIIQQTRDYTDKYWINNLHLSSIQKNRISQDVKQKLIDEIKYTKENDSLQDLYKTCIDYAITPSGVYSYSFTNFYEIFDVYENKLPTSWDYVKHVIKTKKENTELYFEDFYDFMIKRIPKAMQTLDSGYKVSVIRDYKELQSYYSIKDILLLHWNNWNISEGTILKTKSIFPKKDFDINNNCIYLYGHKPFTNIK